jgi:hypothetical protein
MKIEDTCPYCSSEVNSDSSLSFRGSGKLLLSVTVQCDNDNCRFDSKDYSASLT